MTYSTKLPVQPKAMREPENIIMSQLDSKGLDQKAIDRYMDLSSRIVAVPCRWTGTHPAIFAVADTGSQVSRQGIAVYIVKDGKTICYKLTPEERREFHDLMDLDLNCSLRLPLNLEQVITSPCLVLKAWRLRSCAVA